MTMDINGTGITYELWGDPKHPETLVFLNGVMASYSSWGEYAAELSRLPCRILLHDFRGQLLSPTDDGPWEFSRHARDLEELMDRLDIPSAHLIGTSYGGEAAMDFAASRPERTKSITVIDSASEIDEHLRCSVESWITAVRTARGSEFFSLVMPFLYSGGFIAEHREMLNSRAHAMESLPESYYLGQEYLYRTFLTLDLTDSLKHIQCPALVICGEEDILKPPKFSSLISRSIPQSEYVLLPGCGHAAFIEKPREIISMLFGFLAKQGLHPVAT